MGKTISIRFGDDGRCKAITPGATADAFVIAALMEDANLCRKNGSSNESKKRKRRKKRKARKE